MKTRVFIKLLLDNGFVEVKSNGGSHRKFHNPSNKKTVIVPYHSGGEEIKKGLLRAMMNQAGLN